jgi:hypothetical protein
LDFTPGSSQWVNIGLSIPSLNGKAACTVMAWVNFDAFGATRSITEQSIGPPPGTSTTSRLFFNCLGGGGIQLGARDADGGGTFTLNMVGSLTIGKWHHVAAVVDVAGDVEQIYVDGILNASSAPAFPNASFPATNSKNGGLGSNDNGTTQFMDGKIEGYRLYDRRLSDAEIQSIYASRGTDGIVDGLVQSWMLNENSPGVSAVGAGTIKDLSGAGRNIDPVNLPVYQPGEIRTRRKVA